MGSPGLNKRRRHIQPADPHPTGEPPDSWRAAWRPFLVTRGLLFVFTWWSLVRVPVRLPPWQVFPGNRLLDGWMRWDSGWFLTIAREGYRATTDGGESTAGFLPLYPMAAALASLPLRPFLSTAHAVAVGGLLVSQGALLVALAGIHRLGARRLDPATADRALWLVCLFPFSFFLSAVYSESLFLALAVWTFVAADEKRWARAGALASLAVLTRIPGLIVCAALGVEYLHRRAWSPSRVDADALPVALAPLSFGALALHHAVRLGDALAMLRVRTTGWHRPPGLGLLYADVQGLLFAGGEVRCTGVWPCLQDPNAAKLIAAALNLALIPLAAWLSVRAARLLGGGLGFYALGSFVATLVNGIDGTGRVVVTLFPAFLALATIADDAAFFRALCLASAPFLLLLTFYFSHWMQVI